MVHCPYCSSSEMRSNSALSAHLRLIHIDKWNGSVSKSIPEGFNVGEPEPRKSPTLSRKYVRKVKAEKVKKKKEPIHQKIRSHIDFCPHCGTNIKAFELAAGFIQ